MTIASATVTSDPQETNDNEANVRLTDFQMWFPNSEPPSPEEGDAMRALFAVWEPLRLKVRDKRLHAPFSKILIELVPMPPDTDRQHHASVAIGICRVAMVVSAPEFLRTCMDPAWVLSRIADALQVISKHVGWSSDGLAEIVFIHQKQSPPFEYEFSKSVCHDKAHNLMASTVVRFAPGHSEILVRKHYADAASVDIVIFSATGPIYVEETFPAARAQLSNGEYVVKGKNGDVLIRVAVP